MPDLLTISDLELWTRIGVPAAEREAEQRILVSVEMALDTRDAAKADDVKMSVNYVDVADDVKKLAATERKTIERLAEDVARMILKKYTPSSVTVAVKKFSIPGATTVSLQIRRKTELGRKKHHTTNRGGSARHPPSLKLRRASGG